LLGLWLTRRELRRLTSRRISGPCASQFAQASWCFTPVDPSRKAAALNVESAHAPVKSATANSTKSRTESHRRTRSGADLDRRSAGKLQL